MGVQTHLRINPTLCGRLTHLEPGLSEVELLTTPNMTADEYGLVHGGFIFGLADYAAMVAVNHPNVVLAAAESKFRKPVKVGDRVVARANVTSQDAAKYTVDVKVLRANETVFEGVFRAAVLAHHVLAQEKAG